MALRASHLSPAGVRAVRRLVVIWILVLGGELLLYAALGRSRFLDDLYAFPALVVLLAGIAGSVRALRRRRAERRAADRRGDARR